MEVTQVMEEKEMFELETISDKETHVLCVKDYDVQLAKVQEILEDHPVFKITNDEEKKQAKAIRASFNKAVKAIDRRRIDDIADFTSSFTEQCKTLAGLLDERQKAFGEEINAYEESQKAVANETVVKKITATLKYTDPKITDKLIKFAQTNNCELVIK